MQSLIFILNHITVTILYAQVSLAMVCRDYRENLLTGTVEENVTQNQLKKLCVLHRQTTILDPQADLLPILLLQIV